MSLENIDEAGSETESGPDRRSLMKAAALVAVPVVGVGAVAACSGGSTSTSAPSGGNGAVNGKVEVKQSDVPVGGGVITGGAVVTQPSAGTYKAFTSTCTHAGCTVSQVADNQIHCPCHQSVFSAVDGSVIDGPAPAPLTKLTATVSGTNIDVTGLAS